MKINQNYKFDAAEESENVVNWIKYWYKNESGGAKGVVIGISGGADSALSAKLCVEALGKDKVRGVLMPNNIQKDIEDSYKICKFLDIKYNEINIGGIFNSIIDSVNASCEKLTDQSLINIAPRLRMTVIYSLAQTLDYRVAGTGNLSERYVGYCTKWGIDMACDFNPLVNFTKTEVVQIGDHLGLPGELVHKTPADGLTGLSDEENLNITYAVLDRYIRTGSYSGEDTEMIQNIIKMNKNAWHKLNAIPHYY